MGQRVFKSIKEWEAHYFPNGLPDPDELVEITRPPHLSLTDLERSMVGDILLILKQQNLVGHVLLVRKLAAAPTAAFLNIPEPPVGKPTESWLAKYAEWYYEVDRYLRRWEP